MRILILHASHFGRTLAIANRIAHRLRELHHHVDVVDANVDPLRAVPRAYDAVIAGSRVELGRFAAGVVDYLREFRAMLEAMPTAFFSVSMAASDAAVQGVGCDAGNYNATLFHDLGWHPDLSAGFAGGLPYRRYGWILRHVMKAISRSAGHTTDTTRDHVFTDDTAVDAFADRVDAMLAIPRPGVTVQPRARA